MIETENDYFAYAGSGIAGLGVCLAISLMTGSREAWDNPLYFSVGIPVMAAIIFGTAWFFPVKPWRWTLSMALGQTVSMLLAGSSLSLWPLSIIVMLIMSLPQFAAGFLASWLRQKKG